MPNFSELQTDCLKVVTIGYLKAFIGNEVQNSSNGAAMSVNHSNNKYCPTYAELTGGTLIQNWSQGSTPKGDRDGIVVGGSYASNQLVRQKDLSMKYTRFNTLSISRSGSGNLSECGGNETLSYTYNYNRYTKSMNSTTCATGTSSTNVSSICGELTYHTTYGSVSNCTYYSIGKNGSVSSNSRTDSIYADVTFRGTNHTSNTIYITQNALTGSYSVWDKNIATGVTAWATTSQSFGCSGGNYGASATGYYKVQKHWKDSCGTEYTSLTSITDTGQAVSLGSKSGSFGSVTCPNTDCSGSATLSFEFSSGGGYASDSVAFYRSGSNDCGCSRETQWESYDCSQHPGETITVNGTAYTNCVKDAQGNCNCTTAATTTAVTCPTACTCDSLSLTNNGPAGSDGGNLTIGSYGGSCLTNVSVSKDVSWITSIGLNGNSITGHVETNPSSNERSATITVTASECTAGKSFTYKQNGVSVVCSCDSLTVNGTVEPEPTQYYLINVSAKNSTSQNIQFVALQIVYTDTSGDAINLSGGGLVITPGQTKAQNDNRLQDEHEGRTINFIAVVYYLGGNNVQRNLDNDEWSCSGGGSKLHTGDTLNINFKR